MIRNVTKLVGNFTCGNFKATNLAIEAGALMLLENALNSYDLRTKKEAAWIVSNISADSKNHQLALVESGFYKKIFERVKFDEQVVSEEIGWSIGNLCTIEDVGAFEELIKNGLLEHIICVFERKLEKSIAPVLEGIMRLLNFVKSVNENAMIEVLSKLISLGLANHLEKFQFHTRELIYTKASFLIENYFEFEEIL